MCTKPAQQFPWRRPGGQSEEIVSVGYRDEASEYVALSIGYDPGGAAYVLWRRHGDPESIIDRVQKDEKGLLYICAFQCDDARCADNTFLALVRGEVPRRIQV